MQKSNNVLSIFGFFLILYAILAYDKNTPFPSVYTLAPVVGTALIILYAAPQTWVARLLSLEVFVGIGLISYSAYLWHQPLFAFARTQSLYPPAQWKMLLLAILSLIIAYFSWRYIERPFRNRQADNTYSRCSIFVLSVALGSCLILFGLYGVASKGAESSYTISDIQTRYFETATFSPMRKKCHTFGANFIAPKDACEYFGDNISVAVMGDSHTVELAYGLAKHLAPFGIGIKHLSFSSCSPEYELDNFSSDCAKWTQQAINYIETNKALTHVVVSYRITAELNENSPLEVEQTQRALLAIFQRLSATKKVIYVMHIP